MLPTLKNFAERIPAPVGRIASVVPYSLRLGPEYQRTRRLIRSYDSEDLPSAAAGTLGAVKAIVGHAYERVPFYRALYGSIGFEPGDLKDWDDFRCLPIVTRAELQGADLSERSHRSSGAILLNTGGTTGQPLGFYADRAAFAREWAHMHVAWERLEYRRWDLKLTLRGRNLQGALLRYNAVHNEVIVNTYAPVEQVVQAVSEYVRRHRLRFLHGYPSAIYEFVRIAADVNPALLEHLAQTLRGVLYGSEFPVPAYRDFVAQALPVPSMSWYGHSEMAVFAPEGSEYEYVPSYSYGFAEAVEGENGHCRLLGTSTRNTASPFIRYDTGDHIEPTWHEGFLESFAIADGRVGEFVVDAHGTRISLTALIFGRHHGLFGWARFVQVRQKQPGSMTVVVTAPDGFSSADAARAFDATGLSMKVDFEVRARPVATSSGKVTLRVD